MARISRERVCLERDKIELERVPVMREDTEPLEMRLRKRPWGTHWSSSLHAWTKRRLIIAIEFRAGLSPNVGNTARGRKRTLEKFEGDQSLADRMIKPSKS
jgi:hypothetical protein